MEDLLVNKLLSFALKNETPSGFVIAGVLIFLTIKMKSLKSDIESIREDMRFIKLTLLNRTVNGDHENVIPLSDKKSDRSRD